MLDTELILNIKEPTDSLLQCHTVAFTPFALQWSTFVFATAANIL